MSSSLAPVAAQEDKSRPNPSSSNSANSQRTISAGQTAPSSRKPSTNRVTSNRLGCGSRSGSSRARAHIDDRPARASASSITIAAYPRRSSTLAWPRCSANRAFQTTSTWLPVCRTGRSRPDRPPCTKPRWRPCARVKISATAAVSPCGRTDRITPSSDHCICQS